MGHSRSSTVRDDYIRNIAELITFEKGAHGESIGGESLEIIISYLQELLTLSPEALWWEFPEPLIETAIANACVWRAIGKTREDRPALLPFIAQSGDIAVQLFEVSTPTILRRSGNKYEVIGQAYVHGIMHCESVQTWDGEVEKFSLV